MTNPTKQVIVVRSDLKSMTVGKEDAQVGHAVAAFFCSQLKGIDINEDGLYTVSLPKAVIDWVSQSYKKVVLVAHNEAELLAVRDRAVELGLEVHTIVDSGLTCFNEPTLTCISIGPDYDKLIDQVTKTEFQLRLR